MVKKVYVAHPFGSHGSMEANKASVEEKILGFVDRYPTDYMFISPIHATGFLYFKYSYEHGIELCLSLLEMCDEIWMCGDWQKSRGCNIEHEHALKIGMKILYEGDDEFDLV